MKITNRISPAIIAAAVGMLLPSIPELSPTKLIAAIEAYDIQTPQQEKFKHEKPLTVAEAMELLSVSKPTIYRLFEDGTLTKLKVRNGTRIPAEDIEKLLK